MAADQLRLTQEERANLVAFLDGELSEVDSRSISAKMAGSPAVRREIELLQRTWDLLDILPRPRAPEDLLTRTVSLASAETLPDDRLVATLHRALARVGRVIALALIAAGGFAAAYAGTRWAWPDRTARLARELSIVERLDAYRQVERLEYVEQLDQLSNFHETAP
jgi:anti-sigma factor RsiW